MRLLNLLDKFIARIETFFVVIILTSMILLAFLQVILRNFFATSIFWADVFLRHLVLWIGFIGASLATRESKHINIDVLTKLLPQKGKQVSQIIINLFAAVVCFFLMQAAINFIKLEAELGGDLFAGVPTWSAQLIIAIGFGIMMFRFFLQSIEQILSLLRRKEVQA
ncbi:TRAP transporter small permease subunit [candidate division KSB1 bacterium]|nr:TRAP transporter small permease subunit [candidate division KSB1 bacterium]